MDICVCIYLLIEKISALTCWFHWEQNCRRQVIKLEGFGFYFPPPFFFDKPAQFGGLFLFIALFNHVSDWDINLHFYFFFSFFHLSPPRCHGWSRSGFVIVKHRLTVTPIASVVMCDTPLSSDPRRRFVAALTRCCRTPPTPHPPPLPLHPPPFFFWRVAKWGHSN